jgi:hypothetical protein
MQKTAVNTTLAIFFVVTAVMLVGGLVATGTQQAAFADPVKNPFKVTYCHIPPGNPDNEHTVTTGAPAVSAHVRHSGSGDYIGACQPVTPYCFDAFTEGGQHHITCTTTEELCEEARQDAIESGLYVDVTECEFDPERVP